MLTIIAVGIAQNVVWAGFGVGPATRQLRLYLCPDISRHAANMKPTCGPFLRAGGSLPVSAIIGLGQYLWIQEAEVLIEWAKFMMA